MIKMEFCSLLKDNVLYHTPTIYAEKIDTWVHEFTEAAITKIIGRRTAITIVPFPFSNRLDVELNHFLTCLTCTSAWGNNYYTPEEFIKHNRLFEKTRS